MTLASTTSKVQYNGNGSTTAFPFSFKFTAANEIEVILTSSAGVDAVKTITTHYTLSSPGDSGTVTMITAPALGEVLTIRRIMPLTQTTDLNAGGGFSAATIEAALDKLAMIGQQLLEKIRRAPKFRDGSTAGEPVLPDAVANALLGFDSSGELAAVQVADVGEATFPGASTDNAVPRFDGASGTALQSSSVTISDDGAISAGSGTAALPSYGFSADPNTGVFSSGADDLGFATGGALRGHIDASGRFIINSSAAIAGARTLTPYLQVISTSGDASSALVARFVADANGPDIQLAKSRNNGTGGHTVVQSDDTLGLVTFAGSDGTNFETAAQIAAEVDGTPSGNDMPGRLVLRTTADGATALTERVRIDSQSRVTFGAAGAAAQGLYSESPCIQALGTAGNSQISVMAFRSDVSGGAVEMLKSRSATVGTHTIVQSGDGLGNIAWGGSDGTVFREAARMNAAVDGTPGSADMPGRLVLSTTADGASSPTERLRIDSAGAVTARSPTGGIGYGTGAGGAVTQTTSKSTSVTINTVCGIITTHNAALGAGASVLFTVLNSAMATGTVPVAAIGAGGSDGSYTVSVLDAGAAGFNLRLTNNTGGSLGEAVDINFALIRAVNS